jgi:polar amino acid transport system substrate-binding protein
MTDLNATAAASRRSLLLAGGLVGAGAALAANLARPTVAQAQAPAGEALIDKWIRTKKITLGYEFGTPPMQYRDPTTNEPAGYTIELTKLLAADLGEGITIDYVEVPFGQLFSLLESGRCDMIEPVTNLPARALRGDFTPIPAFYAPVYVGLKPNSTVQKPEDLNAENIRFATLQGTSQLAVARRTFPKAQFASFPSATDAINEVASGRADATVQSSSSIVRALDAGARIKLLPTGALYLESVSFFMRQGDPRTLNWMSNWIGYHASIGTLATLYERFVGTASREKYKLQTVAVGPAGQPIRSN